MSALHNLLDVLTDDALLALLSVLDHVSVCRVQRTCKRLCEVGSSPYVWKALYLGGARSAVLEAPTDWLSSFKRINAAWDDQVLEPSRECRWNPIHTPDGVGGQDPKLLDLGGGRVLALGGGFFTERRGGINLRQHPEAQLLDAATCSWSTVEIEGEPPPYIYGSYYACFGDGVLASRAIFFAGGTHIEAHDRVSSLELDALCEGCVRWRGLCGSGCRPVSTVGMFGPPDSSDSEDY
jgi:hypothetical protein